MKLRRMLTFTRRTLLQFRHDRRTLAFIIAMPLLMILIFGYTFQGDVKNVNVEIVSLDVGLPSGVSSILPNGLNFSENVINNLDTEVLAIHTTSSLEVAQQKVKDGDTWAVVVFPANFTTLLIQYLSAGGTGITALPEIEVYVDGSNPTIAGAISKTVSQAALSALNALAADVGHSGIQSPIKIVPTYAYGGGATRFIDYFAPGVISFAIMMVTIIITIILFVNERRNGTLQRLLASPAGESEIVLGYALAFAVIGLIQSIVILVAAILLFGITIEGNIFLALLIILLIGIGHQGLGILLSSGAKNELQAIQFIPLLIFPSVLLAGLFWPVESIPQFLQPLSYFIPLRYGIEAERSIMLRGWGVSEIWVDILILLIFAFLTLTGSILLLRRRE